MLGKYTYLCLMLGTFAVPFLMSFEKKINFISKLPRFLLANLMMMVMFIPWDVLFTQQGIWEFNGSYHLDLEIINLPLEEWLFFIFVPYACLFIYENVKYFVKDNFKYFGFGLSLAFITLQAFILISGLGGFYTQVTFLLNILFLLVSINMKWIGRFHLAYLICIIPFAIVNGVLTSLPVVIYNNSENIGLRLGSIPFEDFFYGMLMMLIVTIFYERR